MVDQVLNAIVTSKVELSPRVMMLRVAAKGWDLPDFTPGQFGVLGLLGSAPRVAMSEAEPTPSDPDKLIRRPYSITSSSKSRWKWCGRRRVPCELSSVFESNSGTSVGSHGLKRTLPVMPSATQAASVIAPRGYSSFRGRLIDRQFTYAQTYFIAENRRWHGLRYPPNRQTLAYLDERIIKKIRPITQWAESSASAT